MASTRPCRVCRKWFRPSRAVGTRQHVCSDPACQRERHRRNCTRWHERNPDYDQETHFEQRLVKEDPVAQAPRADPLEAIDWPLAKGAVGLKIAVLVRETGKVILQRVRDSSSA